MAIKEHLSWDDKKIDSEIQRITKLIFDATNPNKSKGIFTLITKNADEYRKKNRRWNSTLDQWEDELTGKKWSNEENFVRAGHEVNTQKHGVKDPIQTIEYLKSLKDYNKHLRYKEDGNTASLGIGFNTYNQRKEASLQSAEFAIGEDGLTKYEAEFEEKLGEKKQNLDFLYNNSIYLARRKQDLNKKIREKAKSDKIKGSENSRQEQLRKQVSTQRDVDEQLNRSKYFDVSRSAGGTLGIRENVKDNFPLSQPNRLGKLLGINYGTTNGG